MPTYDPARWQALDIRDSHNCYDYAFDHIAPPPRTGRKWSRPGNRGGFNLEPNVYSCEQLMRAVAADKMAAGAGHSALSTTKAALRPDTCWKIAVFRQKTKHGLDFHFMREDTPGRWSHKRGDLPPSDVDASNQAIIDPELANLQYEHQGVVDPDPYLLCGYHCVCENTWVSAAPSTGQAYAALRAAHDVVATQALRFDDTDLMWPVSASKAATLRSSLDELPATGAGPRYSLGHAGVIVRATSAELPPRIQAWQGVVVLTDEAGNDRFFTDTIGLEQWLLSTAPRAAG